jgi:hypothetical protein
VTVAFKWEPDRNLLDRLTTVARQRGQSPGVLVTEVVSSFLETGWPELHEPGPDPLVGLFAGPPDLAIQAEEILQQEITEQSGWTWKRTSP